MCGITGILELTGAPADAEVLRAMSDTLIHRGPDAGGWWAQGAVALGHRRLSIIDLATGQQPMHSPDGELVIVFNGEIYNYIELKQELEALGCHFHTTSDTEVILQAYRTWGVDCQSRFNGMWAFALWDDRRRRLFVSRDRIGEKPLHYATHNGAFVFGSEIKALHAAGVPRAVREELLAIYLTLGYIPAPHTFFKGISKLRPGHFLLIEGGSVSERAYWQLPQCDDGAMRRDAPQICEQFEQLLQDSVRIRMRSDVPFGAFLSGGLDSASVVSLMARHTDRPVETFTIGFAERSFDERELAREVAKAYRTNHHEYLVEPDTFDDSLRAVLHHYDEPFGDSSAIPTGHVARHARQHVKMVLTGDGGDEVLSGYTIYQGEKFAARYQRLPRLIQSGIPGLASLAAVPLRGAIRYRLNRVTKVCTSAAASFADRLTTKLAFLPPPQIDELLGTRTDLWPFQEFLADIMRDCHFHDPFYRLMHFQFRVSLPDQMLTKVDRMSMAHSLETRIPFLDHRLVELMAGVHKDIKMPGMERKHVLRRTVARTLPTALLHAPKKGFVVPLREWFRGDGFQAQLRNLVMDGFGLQPAAVQRLVSANAAGAADNGNFIWMLFLLQQWRRQVG